MPAPPQGCGAPRCRNMYTYMTSHPNKKSAPKTITMARVPRGWPKSSSLERLSARGGSIGFPDMSAVRKRDNATAERWGEQASFAGAIREIRRFPQTRVQLSGNLHYLLNDAFCTTIEQSGGIHPMITLLKEC